MTLPCRKREREREDENERERRKKERERNGSEKERSKERGSKSALSYFNFCFISTLMVSTDSSISRIIDIHSDQSDNSDATFYITSNRVCR